jgi:sulfur carrier protein ThiS
MLVTINKRRMNLPFKGTIAQLLRRLEIRREEVLVLVNGTLAPENDELQGKERIEIIRIRGVGK